MTESIDRPAVVMTLLSMVRPIPADWIGGRDPEQVKRGSTELSLLPCSDWKTLVNAAKKAMRWSRPGEGLDKGLACIMACISSTLQVGDQLWIKLIGVPSSGKSRLCEAVSTARKYVKPLDTFSGLVSGYQADKEGSKNYSLASRIGGMTLIINDGDTLLRLPNKEQVMSQLRTFYGRNIRSEYGNEMSADHENKSCTIVLSGTENLRELDASELGERFLDVVTCKGMDEETEEEIGWRAVCQAAEEVGMEFVDNGESSDSPEMVTFMRLAGGYVEWLRTNSFRLKGVVLTDGVKKTCQRLALFVSFMRGRPSKKHEEIAQRELHFRLAKQIVRLTTCLTYVFNKDKADGLVMKIVSEVAMDTARGRTLEIVKHLLPTGDQGASLGSIISATHQTEDKERHYLRFLRQIGVVESFQVKTNGVSAGTRHRLTPQLRTLCGQVLKEREVVR